MNYLDNRLNKIIYFLLFFSPYWKISQNISLNVDSIKIESEAFLREPITDIESDPLQWWKSRASIYPNLSLKVKHYMCIPATSVPSERVFSTAGNLVTTLRQRLTHENVEMLIFLNKKYKFDKKPIVNTKWMFICPSYWTKKPIILGRHR